MKEKFNGVLLHIGSLPSEYGVGALSEGAFSFVDFLADAKVDFWQTLPLSPTSFGDSPYQSPSAFAGNPYFIDINTLVKRGLLTENEAKRAKTKSLDYAEIFNSRYDVLRCAFKRFQKNSDYSKFLENNDYWLDDFALFMALKVKNGFSSFDTWEKDERRRDTLSDEKIAALQDECDFWRFLQFEFFRELTALKDYAKSKNVALIGDIPIYVAYDSADVWAHPEIFRLDKNMRPKEVAGVPPDYFSADGQLWGNPLYDWPVHKATGFAWWKQRMKHATSIYDVVRIDHFRGFDTYWAIPADSTTARTGKWENGPGMELFDALEAALGKLPIIAEDLGELFPSVRKLLADSTFPGMKVLQFAFSGGDSEYLPHNHVKNSVVYPGTHDNTTLTDWWENGASEKEKAAAAAYLHLTGVKPTAKELAAIRTDDVRIALLRAALGSVADRAIIPMYDWLGLGAEAHLNTPGKLGGNWAWRAADGFAAKALAKTIHDECSVYCRV